MIRSLSNHPPESTQEVGVCSLVWEDSPGHARLVSSLNLNDDLDVPLQNASLPSFNLSLARHDEKTARQPILNTTQICSDDTATFSKADQKQCHMAAGRNVPLSPRAGISPRPSLCGSCEDKTGVLRSPNPPAVSPCSSTSQSFCDVTRSRSSSTSTSHEESLHAEITSRIPCIEAGKSVFVSSTDIREIFFPGCSSPDCNIVVNALKLQMKYPHIPQYMHACSPVEQMTFLQRHLHLVTSGTPLVDVEAFLKHRESLTAMVETKHIMTSDNRSIGCSITHQQHRQQRDEHKKDSGWSESSKTKNNLLPAIIPSKGMETEPGDCESPLEAMVPLSLLPPVFPGYHNQLLLMATGFLTGKDRRVTRMCSKRESRLLNIWHRHVEGSIDQLVTTADLLVKWADVVVIVDPSMKHAVRVNNSHQRQQEQRQQQLHVGKRDGSSCSTPERPCGSRANGTRRSAEKTVTRKTIPLQTRKIDTDSDAVHWMPKILNCFTTATVPRQQNENSTLLRETNKHVSGTTTKGTNRNVSSSQATYLNSKETKFAIPPPAIEVIALKETSKKKQSHQTLIIEKNVINSSPSSSSVESSEDFKPVVNTLTDAGTESKALETTGKKKKCQLTKKKKTTPVRTQSLETLEPSTSSIKTPSPRCSSVQPRPRACKSRRKGTRHSERIASQSKGPCEKLVTEKVEVSSGRNAGTLGQNKMLDKCLTPGPNCKLCKNCGERDASPTEERNNDTQESSTGFKKIANLFSVLSHEEVSHRSKNLISDDIVEGGKKSLSSKTRPLGDLTSKGLEPVPQSNILSSIPSASAKASSKKQGKDTKSNASPKAGKNKSKYPELVIEAQKCLVDTTADMPKRQNSPVSVTDIMKDMDETFNAFKNDPLQIVKDKIKGGRNSTGYVNMDYIRITHPSEGVDSAKNPKPVSLPPIERHDIGPQKKDLLTGVDISSILRTHASETKFSILEESTTLKDNIQSTSKAFPEEDAGCKSVIPNRIDWKTLEPTITSDSLSEYSGAIEKDTQMQCDKAVTKPSWDIEKVVQIKESKSSCGKDSNQDTKKQGMNAEFVAMKAKALAKSKTCPTKSVSYEQQTSQTPVISDKRNCDVGLSTPGINPVPCQGKGETNQSRTNDKQPDSSNSDNGTQERTIQLKKRQKLESSSESKAVSGEELNSHISSYWSDFPVGQRTDSLANSKFGKSRYPIDFFKPSTPVITKRGKQKKTTVEQCCIPANGSNIPLHTPSFNIWRRSPSLTLGHASSIDNFQLQTYEATNKEGMLHARSLSADHFPFDNNVGRKLLVPSQPFFYRDTSDNLNTSTQNTVGNAVARVPKPQQNLGNNKQIQMKDVHISVNNIENASLPSSVKTPIYKYSPSQSIHISRQEAHTSKGRTKAPFHEEARLLAAFNVQRLRRVSDQLAAEEVTTSRRSVSDSGRRDMCQLGNDEYATWNEAHQMWFVDKNRNRNNSYDCLHLAKDKSDAGQTTDLQKPDCPKTNATSQEESKHVSDKEQLMIQAVEYFNILKRCNSKTSPHANSNNNSSSCSDISGESNDCKLARRCYSNVTIDLDYQQAVYPGNGAMIKDEPIKRNILLRETLKENFFLIQKISLCICTCREALQTTKPWQEMHFKKFLKKRYLDSVKHCPLHDERMFTRHQQGLSCLFQATNVLHAPTLHQPEMTGKTKSNTKDGKLRIPASDRAWFKQRQRNVASYSPLEDKCLQLAAEEYLYTYVDQHYKKKMLARYEFEAGEKQDGDDLYNDFFLFLKRYPHKLHKEVNGAHTTDKRSKPDQSHSDSSVKVDREVQRQLRASGSASQQELFLSILKKTHKPEDLSLVKFNTKRDKGSAQEPSHCGNPGTTNPEDINKPSTSKDEPRAHSSFACNYDEYFTNENPEVSYHGLAYVKGVCLPYVVDNGYKYVPIKIAVRLLPRCCCSLVKSLLKKHPKICRTLCTWEQVGLLESISRRLTKKVTSTGEVLLRLDSVLAHLPQLEEELKQNHHARRSKKAVDCLY